MKNDKNMKKFNALYESVCGKDKKIVSEGFIGDVGTGAVLGGVAGSVAGVLGAAAAGACAPIAAGAGLTIGIPLGAIVGTSVWLKHLIDDKVAKKEDEQKIKDLIKKLEDKNLDLKDGEDIEDIKKSYKEDIDNIAKTSK